MLAKTQSLILRRSVPVEAVQRYFAESELSKLAALFGWTATGAVHDVTPGYLWSVCAGMSSIHTTNVGEFLGRPDMEWFEGTCAVKDITFMDADRTADTTKGGAHREKDPLTFWAELTEYFSAHPDPRDDPKGYNEYRPTDRPLTLKHVILRQRGDKILLLDGNHRLLRQVMEGATTVDCYIGRPIRDAEPKLRLQLNEIRRLRDLWRSATDEQVREAILTVVRHLMAISTNGAFAVELFWVMYGREPETQKAGRLLLGRHPDGPDRTYSAATKTFQ